MEYNNQFAHHSVSSMQHLSPANHTGHVCFAAVSWALQHHTGLLQQLEGEDVLMPLV